MGRFYDLPSNARFIRKANWQDLSSLDWLALSRADGQDMHFPAMWLFHVLLAEAAGPWNETLSLGDDGEYFTRILLAAERVLFCSGARCYYRSGVVGNLSGRKSPEAWGSQFTVIELCQKYILAREDSERMRRGFALSWQHLAHACYPYDQALAERALARAKALTMYRPGRVADRHFKSHCGSWVGAPRAGCKWSLGGRKRLFSSFFHALCNHR